MDERPHVRLDQPSERQRPELRRGDHGRRRATGCVRRRPGRTRPGSTSRPTSARTPARTSSSGSATGPTAPVCRRRLPAWTTSRSTGTLVDGAETDAGWTFDGFRPTRRHRDTSLLQRLLPAEYRTVPRLRHWPSSSARTTSRFPARRELGRALPVPGRPADLVLGYVAARQQCRRSPGRRLDPADRRPSGRSTHWTDGTRCPPAAPVVRLDLRAQATDAITLHDPVSVSRTLTVTVACRRRRTFNDNPELTGSIE